MARGFMVINSRFKPFSYEEMLRPIAAYTDEYNTQEAAYGELANNAAQWEKLADSELDRDAYQRYKDYANSLQQAADALASNGLQANSRQALQDVRRRYTEEIAPIEQAYQKRGELSKMQREMMAKDPTTLFERRADNIALKELIANPELSPSTYSGAYLEKSAAQAASALSKQMREDPRKWRSILGNQYYETRMRTGYTADEIQRAVNGDPSAPSELVQVVSQVIQPIQNWQNEGALQDALNYTTRGMWNAIGEERYQNLRNEAYLNPLELARLRASQGADSSSNLFPTRTINIASPSETIGEATHLKKAAQSILASGKLSYLRTPNGMYDFGPTDLPQIDLFDSEGRLRSRESLVREGTNPTAKANIGRAYDGFSKFLGTFGLNYPEVARQAGTIYTKDDIQRAVEAYSMENSPTAMRFEELMLDPSDAQMAVASQVERAIDTDGKYVRGIRKIKSWDNKGNLVFDDSPVKVDEMITKDDKTKKVSVNGIPSILASHNTSIPGQIIKIDGNMYYITPDAFGSQGADMVARQQELADIYNYINNNGDSPEARLELERRRSNFIRSNYAPYTIYAKRTGVAPFFSNLFTKQDE